MHGQWSTALHDNLLFVLLLPLMVTSGGAGPAGVRPPTARRCYPGRCSLSIALLAVLFGVLRNLPFGSWLAPPA